MNLENSDLVSGLICINLIVLLVGGEDLGIWLVRANVDKTLWNGKHIKSFSFQAIYVKCFILSRRKVN